MCHQTTGLVGGELESRGMVTASVSLLPEISRKVRPPRSLAVPYALGFPFGEAHNPKLQRRVLRALLGLLERSDVPVFAELESARTRR